MFKGAIRYYLNSYKGLSKELWLLAFVNLINRCGTMVVPFLSLYLTTKLGYSIQQAGFVAGLYGVGAMLGSLAGGYFTDVTGFRKVQIYTLFFGGILFLVLGQLKVYWMIAVCNFTLGMINEAFRPANSAAMATYSTDENRIRSFTLMRLSFNLGWAIGAGLAGFLAHISYQYLFWVDGITNILSAVAIIYFLPDVKQENKLTVHKNPLKGIFQVFKDLDFTRFTLISVLYLSCFCQLFSNLPVYFKQVLKLNESQIGILSSWNGLMIVFIEMTVIFWIEKNWSRQRAVTIGVLMHVIAYLTAVVFHLDFFGAWVMMSFITLAEMFSFSVLFNYWVSRTTDSTRGQYAGIWTMTWAFSSSLGPFGGSWIAEQYGFTVLWSIVAGISLTAAFLYNRLITD